MCNKVYSIGLWSSYSQCTRGEAVAYALVVVREGYNPNQLNWPAVSTDMYNPTMDVLISGVLTSESAEDHKGNKIGRKLKTGDRVMLLGYNVGTGNAVVMFEMSASILD